MKNFEFLLCFLLCVLPSVFTDDLTSDDEMLIVARSIGITREDLQECLNKFDTDWESLQELSSLALIDGEKTPQTQELIRKFGCLSACIYKKSGVLVNSKIMPEKIMEHVSKNIRRQEELERMRMTTKECSARASSKTDECDIVLSFARCLLEGMNRPRRN